MADKTSLRCDGCGQPASPEHITRRLQLLEWATRYRPVHIGTLFVSAVAPESDSEFLYTPGGEFAGEAGIVLAAAGLSANMGSPEATLAEFQRHGFLLAHVLDCPFNAGVPDAAAIEGLLAARIPAFTARIRRSLRPKKLVPISGLLKPMVQPLAKADLRCDIVLDGDQPFALDGDNPEDAIARLRHALTVSSVAIG
jgi:hypothetical protein